MKTICEMASNTKAYRSEIKKLIEADPKARQIYVEMKAELSAVRQLHESGGLAERATAECTHKTKQLDSGHDCTILKKI